MRNIHGLTLDEPIALIATGDTRIINYNWRGQGMSSVTLDGQAGDISLGNTATQVDWPAATQAETYFAPSPDAVPSNNAKRWLGTFVANGQGTTGMLYRRNRYFDPKSGQFHAGRSDRYCGRDECVWVCRWGFGPHNDGNRFIYDLKGQIDSLTLEQVSGKPGLRRRRQSTDLQFMPISP